MASGFVRPSTVNRVGAPGEWLGAPVAATDVNTTASTKNSGNPRRRIGTPDSSATLLKRLKQPEPTEASAFRAQTPRVPRSHMASPAFRLSEFPFRADLHVHETGTRGGRT